MIHTHPARHHARIGRLIAYLGNRPGITPKSPLGRALAYATNQWPHLEPCFMDGQIEFDNNLTENAIRPTKLGHKNWMFIGREHTGWPPRGSRRAEPEEQGRSSEKPAAAQGRAGFTK